MRSMPIHSGSFASNGSRQLENPFSPAVTTGKVQPASAVVILTAVTTTLAILATSYMVDMCNRFHIYYRLWGHFDSLSIKNKLLVKLRYFWQLLCIGIFTNIKKLTNHRYQYRLGAQRPTFRMPADKGRIRLQRLLGDFLFILIKVSHHSAILPLRVHPST